MGIIGMDIHRVAAEAVALLDGKLVKLGRIPMLRESLEAFARSELTHDDHVVVEPTGNAAAVVEVLAPHVERVVITNPKQVRLIAHAKIKTISLHPPVWSVYLAPVFFSPMTATTSCVTNLASNVPTTKVRETKLQGPWGIGQGLSPRR